MPKINISSPHKHDWPELTRRVEDYLLRLRDEKLRSLDFSFKWADADKKKVTFKGKGFDGHVDLTPGEVSLHVNLSMMLSPFKSKVEQSMKSGLEKAMQ